MMILLNSITATITAMLSDKVRSRPASARAAGKNVWKFAGNAPMEGRKEESAVYPHPQQKNDILSGRLLITNEGDTVLTGRWQVKDQASRRQLSILLYCRIYIVSKRLCDGRQRRERNRISLARPN